MQDLLKPRNKFAHKGDVALNFADCRVRKQLCSIAVARGVANS